MDFPARPFGVYVGRFSPPHAGHQRLVREMLARCGGRGLVVVGGANAPRDARHPFSYADRRRWLGILFPGLPVAGLGDFPTDAEWLGALDDLVDLARAPDETPVYFGGSAQDVRFFLDDGRRVVIVDRFDGSGPVLSATAVRGALSRGGDVAGMVDPAVAESVAAAFRRAA